MKINKGIPVLYLSLNGAIFESTFFITTNSYVLLSRLEDNSIPNLGLPFAYFLNEYINCDMTQLDNLVDVLEKSIVNDTTISQGVYNTFRDAYNGTNNIFAKHFINVLMAEYESSFLPKYLCESETQKLNSCRNAYSSLRLNRYTLCDIFAAYDLMPSHHIEDYTRNKILSDGDYGRQDWSASNQLRFSILPVIKYFIMIMESTHLYLHECPVCNKLFVRDHPKRFALCGGAYCKNSKDKDNSARYKEKLENIKYLKAYRDAKMFFNKRVQREKEAFKQDLQNLNETKRSLEYDNQKQTLPEYKRREKFNVLVKEKKKKVENDDMTEEEFILWVNEQRQKASNKKKFN